MSKKCRAEEKNPPDSVSKLGDAAWNDMLAYARRRVNDSFQTRRSYLRKIISDFRARHVPPSDVELAGRPVASGTPGLNQLFRVFGISHGMKTNTGDASSTPDFMPMP